MNCSKFYRELSIFDNLKNQVLLIKSIELGV
jgi:hypothetical protein